MNITHKHSPHLYRYLYKITKTGVLLILFAFWILSCKNHRAPCSQPAPGINPAYDSLREVYDSIVSQYNASRILIDGLSTRNSVLDSEVRKRSSEITMLKNNIRELETRKIAQVENKNVKLVAELKKEESVNNALKELGSVLHASNIRIYLLHENHNGKRIRTVKRGKKLNVLRMYFDLDENYIADDGVKTLYIVISAPDGKVIQALDFKPGNFTAFNDTLINYTMYKEVILKHNEPLKNVIVNCKIGDKHDGGTYKVSIYNGGYRIGGEIIKLL